MKKTLLALASVLAAGAVMAADTTTGGSLTFKSYYANNNSLKITTDPASEISTANGWFVTLLSEAGAQLTGVKVGGGGATEPVIANFSGTTGFAASGADWLLTGYAQGSTANFMVGAYKGASWAAAEFKGTFGPYSATLGGNDLVPPGPAGKLDFKGAQVGVVPLTIIPEPSVFALGLLGLGAFLIRRRS